MTKIQYSLDQFAKELEEVVRQVQSQPDDAEPASVRRAIEELKPIVQKLLQAKAWQADGGWAPGREDGNGMSIGCRR